MVAAYPEAVAAKCGLGLTPLGCVLAQTQPSWDVIVPILQQAQASIGFYEKVDYPSEGGEVRTQTLTASSSGATAVSVSDALLANINRKQRRKLQQGEEEHFVKADPSLCTCIIN